MIRGLLMGAMLALTCDPSPSPEPMPAPERYPCGLSIMTDWHLDDRPLDLECDPQSGQSLNLRIGMTDLPHYIEDYRTDCYLRGGDFIIDTPYDLIACLDIDF